MEQNDQYDNIARVWDIIDTVGVCMLTTHSAAGMRARPVEPRPDRAAGLIWFVTDLRSGKEHEIETEHDVCLVFIDARPRPISRSRHAPRCGATTRRPRKSGRRPTIYGGAGRTIRMSACCASP